MGNCLKINSPDDISLLRGSDSNNAQDSGPLPIYQASTDYISQIRLQSHV